MTPLLRLGLPALVAGVLAAGCGDDDVGADAAVPDASAIPDAGGDAGADAEVVPSDCETLGLTVRPFVDAPEAAALGDVASDLVIPTTEGDLRLSELWSGCDVLLFVPDAPTQAQGNWGYDLWRRAPDVRDLVEALPPNVHLFFVSVQGAQADRTAALDALADVVDQVLSLQPAEARQWWRGRIHYIPSAPGDLPGWLGSLLSNPGFGLVVDRLQRIRFIGSLGDPRRYDAGEQWFGPNLAMVANEVVGANHQSDLEDALAALHAETTTTTLSVLEANPIAEDGQSWHRVGLTLPDPAEMAGYDTLLLELGLTCVGPGEVGYCPEWDYNVYVNLCPTVDATDCDLELAHHITSYHREGRWLTDVSHLLPLLAAGGPQQLSLFIQDPWEVTLRLHLAATGKAESAVETYPLWNQTETFDATYNDRFDPVVLPLPADAARVELVTAITGHGMSQPGNCAEFCNTDHHVRVNGVDNLRDFPVVGDSLGCMKQAAEGTVPNQYGTWWYGRGGWCPGKQVDPVASDITDQVVLGGDNTFTYEGYYQGAPYDGDSWRHIHVAAWVVVYR